MWGNDCYLNVVCMVTLSGMSLFTWRVSCSFQLTQHSHLKLQLSINKHHWGFKTSTRLSEQQLSAPAEASQKNLPLFLKLSQIAAMKNAAQQLSKKKKHEMLPFLLYAFSWSCGHFSLVCGRKQHVASPSLWFDTSGAFHCNAKHTSVWSSFKGGPVSDAGCFAYIAILHSDVWTRATHTHLSQDHTCMIFPRLLSDYHMKCWNINVTRMTPALYIL